MNIVQKKFGSIYIESSALYSRLSLTFFFPAEFAISLVSQPMAKGH